MLRSILFSLFVSFLILPSIALADPGTAPKKLKSIKALKEKNGAVVVSVRSEIYLPGKLNIFFVREGGKITEKKDVIRFSRKNGFMTVGNDTTDFAPKVFQLAPGRYKLVAHGVDCPDVPSPDQRCGVRVSSGGSGGIHVSRPSRGYGGETPSFEIKAGKITNIGDFALLEENLVKWSAIPELDLAKTMEKFEALEKGAAPTIPEGFVLKKKKLKRMGPLSGFGKRY